MLSRLILMSVCALLLADPSPQETPRRKAPETQPATQPATRPAENPTLRPPERAQILRRLIEDKERARPIEPVPETRPAKAGGPVVDAQGNPLLFEGTMLIERPARLVYEEGRPTLVVQVDANTQQPRVFELLPNQLLELMEKEAKAGVTEFLVSAEVTKYGPRNFVLLRKMLRRVDHGNIRP